MRVQDHLWPSLETNNSFQESLPHWYLQSINFTPHGRKKQLVGKVYPTHITWHRDTLPCQETIRANMDLNNVVIADDLFPNLKYGLNGRRLTVTTLEVQVFYVELILLWDPIILTSSIIIFLKGILSFIQVLLLFSWLLQNISWNN